MPFLFDQNDSLTDSFSMFEHQNILNDIKRRNRVLLQSWKSIFTKPYYCVHFAKETLY